jgi:probable nitrogen fixation protein
VFGAVTHEATGGFLAELVRNVRSAEGDPEPGEGGAGDFALLAPYVVPRVLHTFDGAAPDPEVFWRIEIFHAAVGVAVERRTGVPCHAMLRMHHEGFGRVIVMAGRLVVLSRVLRDAQRFGFESLASLAEAGERLVAEAVEMIERYPQVARLAP